MTPLPQLLYNPHLRAPLGSAGNKGLITPLESALTENSPVTPVESALTKRGGVGSFPSLQHSDIPICLPFIPFIFIRFHTLQPKHPGVGQFDAYPSLPSVRAESRS